MFEIKEYGSYRSFYISEQVGLSGDRYLHCDGSILSTREYWPTKEQAQVVLDKYRPAHVWVHGDVFAQENGDYPKIYIHVIDEEPQVFHFCGLTGNRGLPALNTAKVYTDWPGTVFLFNIKDKL